MRSFKYYSLLLISIILLILTIISFFLAIPVIISSLLLIFSVSLFAIERKRLNNQKNNL
jgi:hypothetical protein